MTQTPGLAESWRAKGDLLGLHKAWSGACMFKWHNFAQHKMA